MNSADIIKQLKAAGWEHVATKGSHHKFANPATEQSVIVPHPKKDLAIGTVDAILKQAALK